MSYLKKIEYEMIQKESFFVIRNCSKCRKKTYFKNTKKFRINANGSKLDVWLIYQCEQCKHTFNLAIYERQKISAIPKDEYKHFLDNDEQLAEFYGKKMQLFQKNKAVVDLNRLDYDFIKLQETTEHSDCSERILLQIHNANELKIRPEKQIAAVLGLSKSQVQKMIQQGKIKLINVTSQCVSAYMSTDIQNISL